MDSNIIDFRLLNFETYTDYLDSYVTIADVQNLPSTEYARLIAELGYNSTTKMLNKDEFEQKKIFISELLNPFKKSYELFSKNADLTDEVLKELAERERPNRVGMLSTIIFIRHLTTKGHEISGYIDYEWSLRMSRSHEEDSIDWKKVFMGEKRLLPTTRDLGYYNWKKLETVCNSTENYMVLSDPQRGLIFLNRHDRKIICPNPFLSSPGLNTTRKIVLNSPRYSHCVLYDHVLRKLA